MTKSHAFNLTGAARKPLIEAIEEFTRVKGVYQGAPKFGYAFMGLGVLDKVGTIHFDCDLQVIMDCVTWLEQCGFACDAAPEETPAFEDLKMTEREELGLGQERHDPPGEDGMQASDVPDDYDSETAGRTFVATGGKIEMLREKFTDEAIDNLEKLVASKAGLIKKSLGVENLTIEKTDELISFPWFKPSLEQQEFTAYAWFVNALCSAAREQKRVTAKEKPVENEKFAFRVFLIKLGFVGDEYKTARKILLRNLTGNSAFKNGAPPKKNESEGGSDE